MGQFYSKTLKNSMKNSMKNVGCPIFSFFCCFVVVFSRLQLAENRAKLIDLVSNDENINRDFLLNNVFLVVRAFLRNTAFLAELTFLRNVAFLGSLVNCHFGNRFESKTAKHNAQFVGLVDATPFRNQWSDKRNFGVASCFHDSFVSIPHRYQIFLFNFIKKLRKKNKKGVFLFFCFSVFIFFEVFIFFCFYFFLFFYFLFFCLHEQFLNRRKTCPTTFLW